MAAGELAPSPPRGTVIARAPRERTSAWPLIDRVGYWLCWAVGIGLCLVALAIVLFMLVKGISYLRVSLLVNSPAPSQIQSQSGGFLDPIEGSLIVAVLGTAIAAPTGVAIAAWLSEYRRPAWLARAVESAIEITAGAPSVVLALFGLLVFAQGVLGFLSQKAASGAVYGRSFFAAGVIMAALALPLIVGSTREALALLPNHLREASYALGRTKRDDDPPRAAPRDPAGHRDRHRARNQADHRRHGDHQDPAGADADQRRPATCPSSGCCAARARR